MWALVVVVRDQLDVEFHDRFEKLKCSENLFVLRAWLQEWDVHQETGLSVEDMVERAFEHSERVHKVRKLSSRHNTVLRRVVREFALEAYKLQQSGTPWFHCPQTFSKTLISEFERLGVLQPQENEADESGAAEVLGVLGPEEVDDWRVADAEPGAIDEKWLIESQPEASSAGSLAHIHICVFLAKKVGRRPR